VIVGEGTAVIRRSPRDVPEFVLDLERYRQADSKIAGVLYRFDGLFTCEATAEGTRVRHREAVTLRPPLAWFAEPLLRGWLARDTAEEMVRMQALLEA
jgi:hypothetical protein